MSNIGEAQITRLTRERLAELKKFIPVRDSFRDNLQSLQQQYMDFTADTKRLFAPITTATEQLRTKVDQVGTEVKKVSADTTKISSRAKKTKKILRDLPGNIVGAQQPQAQQQGAVGQLGEIDVGEIETPAIKTPAFVETPKRPKKGLTYNI